jgi:hypothetical protein
VVQNVAFAGQTFTNEKSSGLAWTTSGNNASFSYLCGANAEGVFYAPTPLATLEGGATTVVQAGVTVSVDGSSAPDGSSVTISTAQQQLYQPNVIPVGVIPDLYYDVYVNGISDGTATTSVTNNAILPSTTMQYLNGAQWVAANNVFVSGNTVSGDIPVSALTGTPIAVGPLLVTQPRVPAGIIYSVAITLTNTQPVATSAPFQQMIEVNSTEYSNYESTDLQNIEFFYANGTLIPSWLESGNSNNATNTVYWLSIANGIPANSTVTVYMGFASPSTNLFNNQTTGEAPQLSPTYGEYDDGANVFTSYWNFAGTVLPSDWSGTNSSYGDTMTVNDGVIYQSSYHGGPYIQTKESYNPENQIADALIQSNYLGTAWGPYAYGFENTQASTRDGYYAVWTGPFCYEVLSPAIPLNTNWNVLSVWASSTDGYATLNYSVASLGSANGFSMSSSSYLGFFGGAGLGSQITRLQWARIRTYPPNGAMPSAHIVPLSKVTLDQVGVRSDFTGTVVVIDGVPYNASVLPLSLYWVLGSVHAFAFQSPLVVPPGSKQYDWASTSGMSPSQSGSITVSGPGNVTAKYVTLVHDVAVTNVVADRTWVYQGRTANINVTVWNNGDFTENVTVTLYYNITAGDVAGVQNVTLTSGQSDVVMFEWNTAGVAPCYTNYTLTAVAKIPADYTPADNTLSDGHIQVRIPGDTNGDGKVNMQDIGIIAAAFGSYGPNHLYPGSPPSPRWNPDADINGDGKVDMLDVAYTARNFGKRA